jgi:dihydroflavonol-4-reductase
MTKEPAGFPGLYITAIEEFMILVTGGTGLVGSHLIWHLLQRGEKIRALHRFGSPLEQVREVFGYYDDPSGESPLELFRKVEWFEADMLDFDAMDDAMKGISKVYHCAAIVSFDPSERKKMISRNTETTANIVNLCLDNNIEKLCHVSSVSALGSRYDGQPVTEDDIWKPSKKRSAYSISKFNSEMEVWRGMNEGLKSVIVNPSVILGPGNWKRGTARFFTRVKKGLDYYTDGMGGFVDVRDVCGCMIALMESGISEQRFIINGENLYYRDFFNMIADELGRDRPTRHATKRLVELGWRLEWLRSKLTFSKPSLTRETARSGRRKTRYSTGKIQGAIGHRFIPIKETVRWTVAKMPEET